MSLRFSVVTISYNQGQFLAEAMHSVLTQVDVELDYTICDPGSTDRSRDVIADCEDQRLRAILTPDDGPADGLNKGFAGAKGDIFYYLNADDRAMPGSFARVARYFDDHPDVDVVCGHAEVIDSRGRTIRRVWSDSFRRYRVATGAHVQIQPATFIRAEAFRTSGGFEVEDRANWDGGLLTSLYLSGARIETINAVLGCYRLHEESITMSGSRAHEHRLNADRTFERLMGRPAHPGDRAAGLALRAVKHARHPRRTFERLSKGPLFRSADGQA